MTKKYYSLFLLVFSLLFFAEGMAQKKAKREANADTQAWRYDIECVGTGKEGIALVKVWSYNRRPDVAAEQAKKNAVHGIIFKGITTVSQGCVSQPALARNPNLEQERKDFFRDFFSDGGKYMKFVNLTTDGALQAGDVIRVNRKQYKVGVIVSVNKKLLRKDLEAAGIIRGLSSGF